MKIKILLFLFFIKIFLYVFSSIEISELGDKDLWNVEYINKFPNKNVSHFFSSNDDELFLINNLEIIHYRLRDYDDSIEYNYFNSVAFPDTLINGFITYYDNIIGITKNGFYIKKDNYYEGNVNYYFNIKVSDIIQEGPLFFITTEDSSIFIINESSYDTIWFYKYDNSTLNIVHDIRDYYIIAFYDKISINEFTEENVFYELSNFNINFIPVSMFFVLINSRYYLIIQDNLNNIHFLDITQIDNVNEIDNIQIDNNIKKICKTDNNYLYVLDDNSNIYIYDYSDLDTIVLIKTYNMENIKDIMIKSSYLHVLKENGVVELWNILNPEQISIELIEDIIYQVDCIYEDSNFLYVSDNKYLYKFDITDINNINLISQEYIYLGNFIKRDNIFFGVKDNGLIIVEYNDTIIKELYKDSSNEFTDIKLHGNYLFANTWNYILKIYDISNINEIKEIAFVSDFDITINTFIPTSDYIYTFGLNTEDSKYYECIYDWTDKSSPQLVRKEKISDKVNSVYIEDNNMFISTNKGLRIIDISNPLNTDDFVSYGDEFAGDIVGIDDNYLYLSVRYVDYYTYKYALVLDRSNLYDLKSVGLINYSNDTHKETYYFDNMFFITDTIQGVEIYKFSENEDSDINNNIVIYPNPVYLSKQDFITINGVKNESVVYIYSSTGRLVKSIHISDLLDNEDYTFSVRDLPNGLYYVYIKLISGDVLKGQFAVIRK